MVMKSWHLKIMFLVLGMSFISSLSAGKGGSKHPTGKKNTVMKVLKRAFGFSANSKPQDYTIKPDNRNAEEKWKLGEYLHEPEVETPTYNNLREKHRRKRRDRRSPSWTGSLADVRENMSPEHLEPSESIYIVGLVDETKIRFQLMKVSPNGNDKMLLHKTYAPGNIKELHFVMHKFGREANFEKYMDYSKPRIITIIVPVRVRAGRIDASSETWQLDEKTLAWNLQVDNLLLINDFQATGYGLMHVKKSRLIALNDAVPSKDEPMRCVGDRSDGFGEVMLMPKSNNKENTVLHTEGGHVRFSPATSREFAFLEYIQKKHKVETITISHVLSDKGLLLVYSYFKEKYNMKPSRQVAAQLAQANLNAVAIITEYALKQKDVLCEKALDFWIHIYGDVIANIALHSLPYGGLYIVPRNKDALITKKDLLMESYKSSGSNHILEAIPVFLVDEDITMLGAQILSRAYFPSEHSETEEDNWTVSDVEYQSEYEDE